MPRKKYTNKLTDLDIIDLFKVGKYSIDLETGTITSTRTGKPIFYKTNSDGGGYYFARLYDSPKHRYLPVSVVCWVIGTQSPVPPNFQIHHRSTNIKENGFYNLFALHKIDHTKLHNGELLTTEVPF